MKTGSVLALEEEIPGQSNQCLLVCYLTGQGLISRLLLIAQRGKNCDLCPGSEKPEEESDSRLLGKVPWTIFIFYESLISSGGDSNNYSKLAPPEKKKDLLGFN